MKKGIYIILLSGFFQACEQKEKMAANDGNLIEIQGKSEAMVWVIDQLNVEGEGSSVMYYTGDPVINVNLEGSSELLKYE